MLSKLKDAVGAFLSKPSPGKAEVEELVRNIQRVLIQSDVDVKLVFELSKRIKERALEKEPPAGMTRREHVIKVVYDELVELLGESKAEINIGKQKILLVGIYGSGKTTSTAKLARYFMKRGLKVLAVAADVHRPAAYAQLKQLCEKHGIDFFGMENERDATKIVREAMRVYDEKKYDVMIVDSAGRSALDDELIHELKSIVSILNPDEKWLVISGDIGQAAYTQAKGFNEAIGITGIIVTKMDSSAKGGGALSACHASGAKVKFIGVGEKIDDLEEYDPVRFVSRLLGMGDLQTLLEKAKEVVDEEQAKRMLEGEFTILDFYAQIENVRKMGGLARIMEMLPLPGVKIPKDMLEVQEEKFKKWKYMIDSMTKEERMNPEIINRSRIERIARGSGTKPEEVAELIKAYKEMKKMIRKLKKGRMFRRGMKMGKLMPGFGL